MKKMVSLVFMVVMALCMVQAVSFAAAVSFTGNATMTYVGTNSTGYEYSVVVNVNATGTDEVSILMFGNASNSAFVTGDTLSFDLDSDGTPETYYVYYVDQGTAASGEKQFSFNVVLPDVAESADYYIWAGSTTMDRGQLTKANMTASGVAFKVASAAAVSSTVEPSAQLQFNIALKDVFGDAASTGVDVLYSSDNGATYTNSLGGTYANGVYTATAPAVAGTYSMVARVTRASGVFADSAPIEITVAAAGPVATGIKGDANNDGSITTYDAVVVLTYAAAPSDSLIPFTAQADVAAPEGVGGTDAVAILQHAARISFISQN